MYQNRFVGYFWRPVLWKKKKNHPNQSSRDFALVNHVVHLHSQVLFFHAICCKYGTQNQCTIHVIRYTNKLITAQNRRWRENLSKLERVYHKKDVKNFSSHRKKFERGPLAPCCVWKFLVSKKLYILVGYHDCFCLTVPKKIIERTLWFFCKYLSVLFIDFTCMIDNNKPGKK